MERTRDRYVGLHNLQSENLKNRNHLGDVHIPGVQSADCLDIDSHES
jgi:hypothetical protein